jgi:hypothetical protein
MPLPYRLYGVAVETPLAFSHNVPRTAEPPALRVTPSPDPFPPSLWDEMTLVKREAGPGVSIPSTLLRHPDGRRWGLRFADAADFLLTPRAIGYHLADPALAYGVEIWLLGTVFSLWNELRGVPALHTAAVAVDGRGVGLLATNKGGKSSLAAALMQAGAALLTDDILMVERTGDGVLGAPSYPQMRMWPDQARHFLGTADGLPLVVPHLTKRRVAVGPDGFGRFQDSAVPVTHLFLPERDPNTTAVRIEPLAPQAALIALVRHSFLPNTVAQLGLSERRLPVLAALARQAQIARLVYPDGVEHLSPVAEAVLTHVRNDEGRGRPRRRTGTAATRLARTARR